MGPFFSPLTPVVEFRSISNYIQDGLLDYFDNKDNASDYIEMSRDYDGRELIEILRTFLPEGASILELGMGPGRDYEILKRDFQVLGTDKSQAFLDLYWEKNPEEKLLLLDARKLDLEGSFHWIFSNKVLHHLNTQELHSSLLQQSQLLKPGGIIFHTFWLGEGEYNYEGIHFNYYRPKEVITLAEEVYHILSVQDYGEEEPGDSFYIILQKK